MRHSLLSRSSRFASGSSRASKRASRAASCSSVRRRKSSGVTAVNSIGLPPGPVTSRAPRRVEAPEFADRLHGIEGLGEEDGVARCGRPAAFFCSLPSRRPCRRRRRRFRLGVAVGRCSLSLDRRGGLLAFPLPWPSASPASPASPCDRSFQACLGDGDQLRHVRLRLRNPLLRTLQPSGWWSRGTWIFRLITRVERPTGVSPRDPRRGPLPAAVAASNVYRYVSW